MNNFLFLKLIEEKLTTIELYMSTSVVTMRINMVIYLFRRGELSPPWMKIKEVRLVNGKLTEATVLQKRKQRQTYNHLSTAMRMKLCFVPCHVNNSCNVLWRKMLGEALKFICASEFINKIVTRIFEPRIRHGKLYTAKFSSTLSGRQDNTFFSNQHFVIQARGWKVAIRSYICCDIFRKIRTSSPLSTFEFTPLLPIIQA